MKKGLLGILIFTLAQTAGYAQFTEISQRRGFSNYFKEFVRGSEGELVLGTRYNQGYITTLYSVGSDSIIWEDGYYNVVWDASQNAQGNVILFVSSIGCDFVDESQLTRLEIAPNGQVVSSTNYQYMVYGDWDYGVALGEDGLIFFDFEIVKIGSDGTVILQIPSVLGSDRFNTVAEGFEDDLLAFSSAGYLARFDQQSNLIDTTMLSQPILKTARSPFGKLYGFSSNAVFEIDSALTFTDISGQFGLGGNIKDHIVDSTGILLLLDDETLYHMDTSYTISDQTSLTSYLDEGRLWQTDSGYYCSGTLGDFGVILRLDETLNVVSAVQMKWMTISDLNVFEGEIWIAGTERHFPHSYDHPSALLKSFDADLTTDSWQNDVELIGVTVDSFSTSMTPNIILTYQYPTVEVRNNGTDTIHSLFLSYHNIPLEFGICELHELGWSTGHLRLAPGEDTLISIPRIPWKAYVQDPYGTGPKDLSLCIYAYNPNEKIDMEHNNNSTCTDFTINVGIDETVESMMSIYPNPFDNELTVQWDETLNETTISVSDVLGRFVLMPYRFSENRMNLNTGDWDNGIYFLIIENKDGRVVRKVVKR